MDGIRKNIPAREKTEPSSNFRQIPPFQKKEELYIPQEEAMWGEKERQANAKRDFLRKILWVSLAATALILISFAFFFLWKVYATTKKINISSAQTTLSQDMKSILSPVLPSAKKYSLRGENDGRINILLMGAAGEHKPGGNLTDTVMIMSIDIENKKIALLSLPRDFYAPIPASPAGGPSSNSLPSYGQGFTKINSLYKIGLSENRGADLIKQAVEKITGITVNYYVTVDFDAFAKIVDDINGINIMVERDIYDTTYPGPNYSYETFALKKGAHLVGGDVALKYVRERHDDPEGDFGRAKRQQQVIQAVKNRIFSAQTLFNVVALSNLLNTLGENIKTDMAFDDIEQFVALSKTLDTQNITNVVVDAWKPDSLLKVSHVMVGNVQAFILIPRVGNYSEIQDLAKNIFNQDEIKKRQDSIVAENASIGIVNKSGDGELGNKIKKLLSEKLGRKNVRLVSSATDEISATSTVSANNEGASKIFTLDELIKKLPATFDSQKNDSDDNITVTLGTDLVDVYKYEEDSIDDFKKAQDTQDNIDFTKQN